MLFSMFQKKNKPKLYMKDINLQIKMKFAQMDELSPEDRELVQCAIDSTSRSYSKYSHFSVGAAIRLQNGEIVLGANQENAVFPVGLCAERTAIFAAQVAHPELSIDVIAISAKNAQGELTLDPVTPCGSCRQVMLEMEDRYKKPMRVLLYGKRGVYVINTVRDLMPLSFAEEAMEKQ